ncbi:hypothetical protein B0J13DRAFT_675340 [Dactylonectria estremocensis]|uniref:Uncharacterized protein n=1 Tax=Dactylonectria estremocensis TaxID=1079267 RepID=A0A9P9J733_9HYPO|nr:hypothetical protein B0J13DRAFT_675340 [Dactylonectria estremocensis]
MIVQDVVSDPVLSLAGTDVLFRQNDPQRLRLVSQDMKALADTIIKLMVICSQTNLPAQPKCILTTGELPALRLFFRQGTEQSVQLPPVVSFTKVIAITDNTVAQFYNDLHYSDPLAAFTGIFTEGVPRPLLPVADLNGWKQIKEMPCWLHDGSNNVITSDTVMAPACPNYFRKFSRIVSQGVQRCAIVQRSGRSVPSRRMLYSIPDSKSPSPPPNDADAATAPTNRNNNKNDDDDDDDGDDDDDNDDNKNDNENSLNRR